LAAVANPCRKSRIATDPHGFGNEPNPSCPLDADFNLAGESGHAREGEKGKIEK
jgi:hypothetical protein